MAAPQLQVLPENFNVSPVAPEEGRILGQGALSHAQEGAHLKSALPPELGRRVAERALFQDRPVLVRLTVEGEGNSASVELPIHVDPTAVSGFRLTTPVGAEGFEFVLDGSTDGSDTLRINARYAGLSVNRALSYARFLRALYWDKGTLYLTRLEPYEERFALFDLPLPLNPSNKSATEDRVRFLEALDEIGRAAGTALVCPSEVDEGNLRNLNHILKVIRGGWVALPVTDFTTPMTSEGVKNILDLVKQDGDVVRDLAMTS